MRQEVGVNLHAETQSLLTSIAASGADVARGLDVRSPIDGSRIGGVTFDTDATVAEKAAHAETRVPSLAQRASAPPRRAGAPIRRAGARTQGAARAPGLDRGGQDPAGGAGRSAGSDRHLRFRRRVVAPAARPDHRQRAARSSHDGDVASARPSGGDQCLQLSRSRCGLGTRRWRWRAAIPYCGSPRRRRRSPPLPCMLCWSAPATQWAMCPRT